MVTAGRKVAGSGRDSRINLTLVAQAQEAPCWCMQGSTDPVDLVITVLIIIATAYCTTLQVSVVPCHLILKIGL